jgi:DNA-binding PadR family transcriptional regulator
MYSSELVKGTLKTIILSLLANEKEMYGYEISKRVEELTKGKIQITEGALYPLLHKMEADGLVFTREENIGKRVRKYYRVSEEGKAESKERSNELRDFIATLSSILNVETENKGYGLAQ